MSKTTKIMDINMMAMNGLRYICIFDSMAQYNPFKLYQKWYDPMTGWHKKKIDEFADTQSVLFFIAQRR